MDPRQESVESHSFSFEIRVLAGVLPSVEPGLVGEPQRILAWQLRVSLGQAQVPLSDEQPQVPLPDERPQVPELELEARWRTFDWPDCVRYWRQSHPHNQHPHNRHPHNRHRHNQHPHIHRSRQLRRIRCRNTQSPH